jgi:hypothetical protein
MIAIRSDSDIWKSEKDSPTIAPRSVNADQFSADWFRTDLTNSKHIPHHVYKLHLSDAKRLPEI